MPKYQGEIGTKQGARFFVELGEYPDQHTAARVHTQFMLSGAECYYDESSDVPGALLVLKLGDDFQYLKVWETPLTEQWDEVQERFTFGPPPGVPIWSEETYKATVLGRFCTLEFQQYVSQGGHVYLLPMFLNQQPALEVLGANHLADMLRDYAKKVLGIEQFTVVMPHEQLPDWEEAREYIKDLIKDTTPKPVVTEKTARAWPGWTDNGKEG